MIYEYIVIIKERWEFNSEKKVSVFGLKKKVVLYDLI